jgi:hypothetical protein
MRVDRSNVVDADRDTVWKIVSDPDRYPSFMTRLERWESADDQALGVGARYFVHWKVGSVPVGGLRWARSAGSSATPSSASSCLPNSADRTRGLKSPAVNLLPCPGYRTASPWP